MRTAPRDALIADSTDPQIRGRAFGFHRAMDHLGAAIGPLLATIFLWLWPGQIRALFVATALPGAIVLALLIVGLKETATATRPEKIRLTLGPFDRNFRLYLIALVVFTLGNSSDAFLLVRAKELGVPTTLLPALWCAFHVVKSSSNFLLGHGVDRFGPRPFLYLGWFVYGCVYLAFGFATTAIEAWACFLVYALFYGLTEPAEKTLVANLVGAERKGLAYGWYNFAIGIATLPASVIFGALYQRFGALPAFGFGAALAILATAILACVKQGR
jgi:MFS family permease